MNKLKRNKSFTIIELLFVAVVSAMILTVVIMLYIRMIGVKSEIEWKQTLIQSAYGMMERVGVLMQNYTIDYEEYYNRKLHWCGGGMWWWFWNVDKTWEGGTWNCANFTEYGNNSSYAFGSYATWFWTPWSDGIWGTDDDYDAGDSVDAISDNNNVQELYLISKDKKERLFLRRKFLWTANYSWFEAGNNYTSDRLYSIQMLRLRWFDAGKDHNFTINATNGAYDGKIDTRACDYSKWFTWSWAALPSPYSNYHLPANSDDCRVDFFPSNLTISSWNLEINPTKDPTLAWDNLDVQMNPYVKINIKAKLFAESWFSKIPSKRLNNYEINLQTMFNIKTNYANPSSNTQDISVSGLTPASATSSSWWWSTPTSTPINGVCWTANKTYSYTDTSFGSDTLCTSWTASPASIIFPDPGTSVSRQCLWLSWWVDTVCTASRDNLTIVHTEWPLWLWDNFWCALSSDASVYCWGYNGQWALWDGTKVSRTTASKIPTSIQFSAIGAGFYHACGITAAGDIYCWGDNAFSQLWDGTNTDRTSPTKVNTSIKFKYMSVWWNNTCAISTDDYVYCWGRNLDWQIWDGTSGVGTNKAVPTKVSGTLKFATITVGSRHVCWLLDDGTAYCWGGNNNGELWDGTKIDKNVPTAVSTTLKFTQITYGCGLSTDGRTYCWGANEHSQLWDGTSATFRSKPSKVYTTVKFSYIFGRGDRYWVTSNFTPYVWGINWYGQAWRPAGSSGGADRITLPMTLSASTMKFSSIDDWWNFCCGINAADNKVYCWGRGAGGELWNWVSNSSLYQHIPVPVVWYTS